MRYLSQSFFDVASVWVRRLKHEYEDREPIHTIEITLDGPEGECIITITGCEVAREYPRFSMESVPVEVAPT